MTQSWNSPQDAEDAFYDALEEGDLVKVLSVWADTDEISCLLPMFPLVQGREGVQDVFTHLFSRGQGVSLSVRHLDWIQWDEVAIHQVEERVQTPPAGHPPPPPFYGMNIYRKYADGWRLIVHQNSPTPSPPPAGQ